MLVLVLSLSWHLSRPGLGLNVGHGPLFVLIFFLYCNCFYLDPVWSDIDHGFSFDLVLGVEMVFVLALFWCFS